MTTVKVKSVNVSVSAPGVDPSILRELGDRTADAQNAAEDAKATDDEAQKESGETKDAASDAQEDAISAQDAASDAKNAVD
jgi:hypothetical protein